jgi:hypothetical protein
MKNTKVFFLLSVVLIQCKIAQGAYIPSRQDSGWVRLFNGKNLDGLFPHIDGGKWGENLGNAVTVHDSMIHFYQGRKRANKDAAPNGVLSTGIEFAYYQSRVEYKHGDIKDDGWLGGDPYNSGFFYHAKEGNAAWPPAIECQLKRHWNAKANKPCSALAGDCDQLWAGDFWLLSGVQVTKDGVTSALGGCCNPTYATHKPDVELEGWNKMEIQVWSDSLFQNLLNGTKVNYGTKSTWQPPQGPRVRLTEGRVQLELEGSEVMFKNWEIRLLKQDPLYKKWYVEGCRDPAFKEYLATANLHIASLCLTPATVSIEKNLLHFYQAHPYLIEVFNLHGQKVTESHHSGKGTLDIAAKLPVGIYFLAVRDKNTRWTHTFYRY